MPGVMIAMGRLNRPAIMVYGGTIKPGYSKDNEPLDIVSAFQSYGITPPSGSCIACVECMSHPHHTAHPLCYAVMSHPAAGISHQATSKAFFLFLVQKGCL